MCRAGNTSAKGHIPFVIFALLDVLRAFPGQVPLPFGVSSGKRPSFAVGCALPMCRRSQA